MTEISRRAFALGAATGTALLAGCGNGIGSRGSGTIDARVASTRNFMFNKYPGTRDLANKAAGMLVMPLITEAGLGVGASYGRGALLIDGITVDYYSAATATIGFQIGAQQYAHVLFFMTQEALLNFRRAPGWVAGANVEYAVPDQGESLLADTATNSKPVIAVIFGQAGLRLGATLDGTKYTRIIP